jgi:hypothetical protein
MPCIGKPDGTVETLQERYAREAAVDQELAREYFMDYVMDQNPDVRGMKTWEVEVVVGRLMKDFKDRGNDVGDEYAEAAEIEAAARRLMKRPPSMN